MNLEDIVGSSHRLDESQIDCVIGLVMEEIESSVRFSVANVITCRKEVNGTGRIHADFHLNHGALKGRFGGLNNVGMSRRDYFRQQWADRSKTLSL